MLAVPSGLMGESNYYMNWKEVQNLSDKGWQIASHSINHKSLFNFTKMQRAYEFKQSYQDIYNNIGAYPTTFVYPFGDNNNTLDDECAEYYDNCIGYAKSINKGDLDLFIFKNSNRTHENGFPLGLRRFRIDNDTSLQVFKDALDSYSNLVLHLNFVDEKFQQSSLVEEPLKISGCVGRKKQSKK